MPSQILAIEGRIVDSYVLALPKRILGNDVSIVNLYILTILEHVFCIALQSVYIDILREHKGVSTLVQLNILKSQSVNLPEGFISIVNHHILKLYILHLTEELRTIDGAILHHQIVGVPDGRTRSWCKITTLYTSTINMPPGIFAIKLTVITLHTLALLDARFTINNHDILQTEIVSCKKRSLTSKFFVFYQFHCFCIYSSAKVQIKIRNQVTQITDSDTLLRVFII